MNLCFHGEKSRLYLGLVGVQTLTSCMPLAKSVTHISAQVYSDSLKGRVTPVFAQINKTKKLSPSFSIVFLVLKALLTCIILLNWVNIFVCVLLMGKIEVERAVGLTPHCVFRAVAIIQTGDLLFCCSIFWLH